VTPPVTSDALTVLPEKRRGRPRAAEPLDIPISTRLSARQYDAVYAAATATDLSISRFLRNAVVLTAKRTVPQTK
jgi:uncharacterized protein (DUF1778 family)